MKEMYNPKYFSVNLIPEYRIEFIRLRVKEFTGLLKLQDDDWPLMV